MTEYMKGSKDLTAFKYFFYLSLSTSSFLPLSARIENNSRELNIIVSENELWRLFNTNFPLTFPLQWWWVVCGEFITLLLKPNLT